MPKPRHTARDVRALFNIYKEVCSDHAAQLTYSRGTGARFEIVSAKFPLDTIGATPAYIALRAFIDGYAACQYDHGRESGHLPPVPNVRMKGY